MRFIKFTILTLFMIGCYGPKPLYKEILKENYDYIALRLEQGADPSYKTKKGLSPLMMTINEKDYNIALLLVKNGANLETGWNGINIIKSTLQNSYSDENLSKEYFDLLAELIDIDKKDNFRLFQEKKGYFDVEAIYHSLHSYKIFKFLLDKGVPFEIKNEPNGSSIIIYALYYQADPKVIDYLLKLDPTLINQASFPLYLSKYSRKHELENSTMFDKFIVKNGESIDNFAIEYSFKTLSNSEYFDKVIEKISGDYNFLIKIGNSTLDKYISLLNFAVIVEKLNSSYSKYSRYQYRRNDFDLSCSYVGEKAKYCSKIITISPNELIDEISLLHFASALDRDDLIEKLIIDKKISPNIKSKKGITPLIIASWFGNISVIEILLENGANIEDVSHYQQTALFFAVQNRQYHAVEYLISKGANINHLDIYKNLPIQFAKWNFDEKMLSTLKKHKSDERDNIFTENNKKAKSNKKSF